MKSWASYQANEENLWYNKHLVSKIPWILGCKLKIVSGYVFRWYTHELGIMKFELFLGTYYDKELVTDLSNGNLSFSFGVGNRWPSQ